MAQPAATQIQTQSQTQVSPAPPGLLQGYDPDGFFCETMRWRRNRR